MTAVLLWKVFKVSSSLYLHRICSSFTCVSGGKGSGVEMMWKGHTFTFTKSQNVFPFHLRKDFFFLYRSMRATAKLLREYFVSKHNFSSSNLKLSWIIKCWGPHSATFIWARILDTRYSETGSTKYLHCLKAKKKTLALKRGNWHKVPTLTKILFETDICSDSVVIMVHELEWST